MPSVFEGLEDAFFKRAETLSSDVLQSRFIYSIRELRDLREPVSNAFVRQVQKNLDQFFAADLAATSGQPGAYSYPDKDADSLALMNRTELEEDLAVLAVITKGEQRYQNALQQLTALWASFTGRPAMVNAENPLRPGLLVNRFRESLAGWQGDHVVRPVVYDTFYEYVIASLGELYQGLIDDMRAAGVQPVEKSSQKASKSSGSSVRREDVSASAATPGDVSETEPSIFELVNLVRNLFDSQRRNLGLSSTVQASRGNLAPLRPDVVVDVLSNLQQQFTDGSAFDLQAAIDSNGEFKRTLHKQLEQLSEQQHKQVQELDQHILNVVMMLFDFVLEDPVVPAPMKVMIARLQIPVLQVAIHDRVFLSDRSHPARSLLNNLSRAAVRWVDDGDHTASSMYGMIEQAVNRIAASDKVDKDLYTAVNEEFCDYLEREERAAVIAEKRLSQLARGQEQLATAREKVSAELDRLMHDQIPVAAYKIIRDAWTDVLTLTWLREGEGSAVWVKMVNVAERLVDSVTLKTQESERQKIMRDIPLLLADLREGFFSISYDAAKTASMLKQLQLCHVSVLRGVSPQMQAVSRKHVQEQSVADAEDVNDHDMQIAESIEIGQWLSWIKDDGKEMRGKLSWRSEIADLLLFVDIRGRKVIEMTSRDLSDLFRNAQARVIQEIDEPIMDRAMRVAYNMLRQTSPQWSGNMSA